MSSICEIDIDEDFFQNAGASLSAGNDAPDLAERNAKRMLPEIIQPVKYHLNVEMLSPEMVTLGETLPESSGHSYGVIDGMDVELDQSGSEATLTGTLVNERTGSPTLALSESVIVNGCVQEPGSIEAEIGQALAAKGSHVDRHPAPKQRRKIPIPAKFKTFPVYHHRQQITDHVRLSSVTLVSGPTGSGKSALIPILLDNDAHKHKESCSIVVAMPRRIAAVSLCGYVCQEINRPQGAEVGFQIGMVRAVASSQTRILYCTVGILLQKMMHDSDRPLSRFSHIILDEVHERSEDIDFTMMLAKLALDAGESFPKLVIMSATMNSKSILSYFQHEYLHTCPPLVKILDAPLYPVKEVYLEEMSAQVGCHLGELTFDLEKPYAKHDLMNLTLAHIAEMHRRTAGNVKGSTTLIFLPGLEDIEKMIDKIHCDYADKLRGTAQWEICPLHSLIPQHIQGAVFLPVRRNILRIVVASNIAESSITVPEVERVYDFCLTKNMVTDDETKLSYLQIQWTTKSSCDQRKGRAGRTRTGTVYRLVYEDFFRQLADHPDPEILNVPVTKSILRSKMLKLEISPAELMERMISPPAREDVKRAVHLLQEKGALSLYHVGQLRENDGDLTYLGSLCATLPLSVPLIRLIFLTFCCGLVDDGIVLACIISVQSIFQTTWMDDTEGWISKKKNDCGLRSDCLASFRIFREWIFQSLNGQFGEGQNSERERLWCMQYRLSRSRMQEIMFTISEIRRRLSKLGLCVEDTNSYQSKFEPDKEWEVLMKMAIAGAFYPDYMIHSPPDDDKTTSVSIASSNAWELSRFGGFDPVQCVEIAVPTKSDTLSAIFYESLLRQYIRSILRTEVFPSITYLRNRAVVCLEQGVGDVAGHGSLLVEQLLRSTKKQRRRTRAAAFRIPTVTEACVDAFSSGNPEVTEMVKGTNCWVALDYSLWYPEIPQPTVLAYHYGDLEFYAAVSAKVDSDLFFARLFHFGSDPLIQLNKELQALLSSDLVRKCLPSDKESSLLGKHVISYMRYPSEQIARAKVVRIENDNVEVYLIDYGQMARLPWNRTFIVLVSDATRCFWETPKLAVKCRLAECFSVLPLRNISVFDRLQQETAQLVVMVSHSKNGVVVLKNIDVLTESGRDCLSVRLWEERFLEIDTEFDAKMEAPDVTELVIPAVKVKPEYTDAQDITFGNPVNSYDIGRGGYRWMYQILRFIEAHQESVNAVLLRTRVPDPVDYVLVSCETVVSKRKNMVVCADTTLMPHIPGMAALLGMLYAPVVETRRVAETGEILGCFCGLGAISRETDVGILPLFVAHDFMRFADGVLDQVDMDLVKSIRQIINMIVHSARSLKSVEKMDGEAGEKIQKRQTMLRQTILMLMQRKRRISLVPPKKRSASVCPPRWLSPLPNSLPVCTEASVDRITYEL